MFSKAVLGFSDGLQHWYFCKYDDLIFKISHMWQVFVLGLFSGANSFFLRHSEVTNYKAEFWFFFSPSTLISGWSPFVCEVITCVPPSLFDSNLILVGDRGLWECSWCRLQGRMMYPQLFAAFPLRAVYTEVSSLDLAVSFPLCQNCFSQGGQWFHFQSSLQPPSLSKSPGLEL